LISAFVACERLYCLINLISARHLSSQLFTIPLNWVALLAYLVVRALQHPRRATQEAAAEANEASKS
jgi:hypothetical protein